MSTFLVAWTLYIFDQHDKPSHLLHGAKRQPEHILDTRFRAWLHFSVFRRKTHLQLSDRSIHLLQRLLIAFSDGHLITGLAMLVAAFSQTQSITIFHFNVAVYLAWLSSSVHMVTLSVCRSYLQSSPFLVYWRLGAAGILWLLLLVSLAMTASPRSPVNRGDGEDDLDQAPFFWYDTPVLCTWHCSEMSKWPVDTIVASVLIALGFLSRAVKLIKPLSEQFGRVVVHQTSDIVKKTFTECAVKRIHVKSRLQKNGWSLCMWLTLILYLNLRALFDLFGSLLGELFWISLLLAWGTSKLVLLHLRSPLAENDWGFGQVLPLLLLLAPFAAIPELYLGKPVARPATARTDCMAQHMASLRIAATPQLLPPHPASVPDCQRRPCLWIYKANTVPSWLPAIAAAPFNHRYQHFSPTAMRPTNRFRTASSSLVTCPPA